MTEKQFLKTASRVQGILERDPFAREDDIYLTWQYWRDIDPGLDDLTMKEFKTLFLSGYFGLPASITRSRALIQNKTNPSLAGVWSKSKREERGESLRRYFASQGVADPLSPDQEIISRSLEGDIVLDHLELFKKIKNRLPAPGSREISSSDDNEIQGDARIAENDGKQVNNENDEDMKIKKQVIKEDFLSLGEYIPRLRIPRDKTLIIDFKEANVLRDKIREICKQRGTPPKIKKGEGHREGLTLETFPESVIKEVFNQYLKTERDHTMSENKVLTTRSPLIDPSLTLEDLKKWFDNYAPSDVHQWNHARGGAKEFFPQEVISALDGSGYIRIVLNRNKKENEERENIENPSDGSGDSEVTEFREGDPSVGI